MLKIRLQRVGRKHEPTFRLVLTESKNSSKSGKFAEVLGSYDPRKTNESFAATRIEYWLSRGAGLTGSVNNLLVKKGIIRGKKTHVGSDFVKKEAPIVEEAAEAPAPETSSETSINADEAPQETPAPESDTIKTESEPSE